MTRLLFSPLVLCLPLFCCAQASSGKGAALVALAEPASVHPLSSATAATPASNLSTRSVNAANPVTPVSSGIVAPKLIFRVAMKDNGNRHIHLSGRERSVTIELTVNELGQPTNLHITVPVEEALDSEVLATLGKFRYEPGTLDGKPIPMPLRIHYVVPVGAIY